MSVEITFRKLILVVLLLGGAWAQAATVSEIKHRVMEHLNQIPPNDTKFACILKFTVASYNLKANNEIQLLVNMDFKNNGVFKQATLVDLPVSFNDVSDLDKLKDELKDELTTRSCTKKDNAKKGPVEFVKDFQSQSEGSVKTLKDSETLSAK